MERDKDIKYVRFYFDKWNGSTDVMAMTLEERGVYITLLMRQAEEGAICYDDVERMSLWLRGPNEASLSAAEIEAKITPKVRSKFKPVPDRPGYFRNERLMKEFGAGNAALIKKKQQIQKQEAALAAINEEEAPEFDFVPILKAYPRTKHVQGNKRGIALMVNTVTDKATYGRLWAAAVNYAKITKRSGIGPDKIKRLDNWMGEWTEWVPKDYDTKVAAVQAEVQEEPPVPVLQVESAPPKKTLWPWEEEGADAAFWNAQNRARFMNDDDPRKDS